MTVKILACTAVMDSPSGWEYREEVTSPDAIVEMAGRNCYQSWDRPNPETDTNRTYIAHVLEVGHLSLLDHASATFQITDVSTSFLGQLSRHHHLSLSVESARFVDKTYNSFVTPPAIRGREAEILRQKMYVSFCVGDEIEDLVVASIELYNKLVEKLLADGYTRKQAREAARSVLPQGISTNIIVTGNMRAWREMLGKRLTPHADAEFQEVAAAILAELKIVAPNCFQDM
jgi:thymidylate synthase (FAD)